MFKILLVLGLAWAANACTSHDPGFRLPMTHPSHSLVSHGALRHSRISHSLVNLPLVRHPLLKHPHAGSASISPLPLHQLLLPKQDHDQTYVVPPYYRTRNLVERMENELLAHTTFIGKPALNDPLRHYMLLIGMIYHITEVVANTCHPDPVMYDRYYMAMFDEYVSRVWNDPHIAAEQINFYITLAKSTTADIRNLITDVCGTDNIDPRQCDKMVAGVLVYSPDKYKEQAKHLLKMGQLAEIFEPLAPELEDIAKNQQEINFLLDDMVKERLKPLVLTAAEVIIDFQLLGQCENPPPSMHIMQLPKSHRKYWSHHKSLLPRAKMPIVPGLWG